MHQHNTSLIIWTPILINAPSRADCRRGSAGTTQARQRSQIINIVIAVTPSQQHNRRHIARMTHVAHEIRQHKRGSSECEAQRAVLLVPAVVASLLQRPHHERIHQDHHRKLHTDAHTHTRTHAHTHMHTQQASYTGHYEAARQTRATRDRDGPPGARRLCGAHSIVQHQDHSSPRRRIVDIQHIKRINSTSTMPCNPAWRCTSHRKQPHTQCNLPLPAQPPHCSK